MIAFSTAVTPVCALRRATGFVQAGGVVEEVRFAF
jgi:hypothetical protein